MGRVQTTGRLRPYHDELCGSWVLVPVPQRRLVLCNGVVITNLNRSRMVGDSDKGSLLTVGRMRLDFLGVATV